MLLLPLINCSCVGKLSSSTYSSQVSSLQPSSPSFASAEINDKKYIEDLSNEIEIILSSQLNLDIHNYPANKEIPIRITDYGEEDKLYYVLIDYPNHTTIKKKQVYIFGIKYGMYELINYYEYKYLGIQDVKNKLINDYTES